MLCQPASATSLAENAYGFSFPALDGRTIALEDYRGKPILIVNTASQCGFTPQYKQLQELYSRYKHQGLVVIAVPSNDFGLQEPGSVEDITHLTQDTYAVKFPVTGKQVVNGKNAHPFYRWAADKVGIFGTPKWNFHKYLLDRNGHLVDWFSSTTKPLDTQLVEAIEQELRLSTASEEHMPIGQP